MQGRLWSEANADVSELVLVISITYLRDQIHKYFKKRILLLFTIYNNVTYPVTVKETDWD